MINNVIAAESKAIAEETRRDSTSMKTIAGLTMIYLPYTFAATLFSTGFFSFASASSENFGVGKDVWILFVLGTVLMLATGGLWVCLNRLGLPRWSTRLGLSSDASRISRDSKSLGV